MMEPIHNPLVGCEKQIQDLRQVGQYFYSRGWSTGTSSNYSLVVQREPLQLLITASGAHKGCLRPTDFVRIDAQGQPVVSGQPKASAETWLHLLAASQSGIDAVLHTHSIWGTLLSDLYYDQGGLWISGYEMLKGLEGVTTHAHRQWIPIYENSQDIPRLAEQVRPQYREPTHAPFHGYLIRRHGLYTWGHDLSTARRHVEILEFLFECLARRLSLNV